MQRAVIGIPLLLFSLLVLGFSVSGAFAASPLPVSYNPTPVVYLLQRLPQRLPGQPAQQLPALPGPLLPVQLQELQQLSGIVTSRGKQFCQPAAGELHSAARSLHSCNDFHNDYRDNPNTTGTTGTTTTGTTTGTTTTTPASSPVVVNNSASPLPVSYTPTPVVYKSPTTPTTTTGTTGTTVTPTPVNSYSPTPDEATLVDLINEDRADYGVSAVTVNMTATEAATAKAQDIHLTTSAMIRRHTACPVRCSPNSVSPTRLPART